MGSGTSSKNKCGLVTNHAYTILSAFNMIDVNKVTYSCLLIRNPWGVENYYNQSWNAKDTKWTN